MNPQIHTRPSINSSKNSSSKTTINTISKDVDTTSVINPDPKINQNIEPSFIKKLRGQIHSILKNIQSTAYHKKTREIGQQKLDNNFEKLSTVAKNAFTKMNSTESAIKETQSETNSSTFFDTFNEINQKHIQNSSPSTPFEIKPTGLTFHQQLAQISKQKEQLQSLNLFDQNQTFSPSFDLEENQSLFGLPIENSSDTSFKISLETSNEPSKGELKIDELKTESKIEPVKEFKEELKNTEIKPVKEFKEELKNTEIKPVKEFKEELKNTQTQQIPTFAFKAKNLPISTISNQETKQVEQPKQPNTSPVIKPKPAITLTSNIPTTTVITSLIPSKQLQVQNDQPPRVILRQTPLIVEKQALQKQKNIEKSRKIQAKISAPVVASGDKVAINAKAMQSKKDVIHTCLYKLENLVKLQHKIKTHQTEKQIEQLKYVFFNNPSLDNNQKIQIQREIHSLQTSLARDLSEVERNLAFLIEKANFYLNFIGANLEGEELVIAKEKARFLKEVWTKMVRADFNKLEVMDQNGVIKISVYQKKTLIENHPQTPPTQIKKIDQNQEINKETAPTPQTQAETKTSIQKIALDIKNIKPINKIQVLEVNPNNNPQSFNPTTTKSHKIQINQIDSRPAPKAKIETKIELGKMIEIKKEVKIEKTIQVQPTQIQVQPISQETQNKSIIEAKLSENPNINSDIEQNQPATDVNSTPIAPITPVITTDMVENQTEIQPRVNYTIEQTQLKTKSKTSSKTKAVKSENKNQIKTTKKNDSKTKTKPKKEVIKKNTFNNTETQQDLDQNSKPTALPKTIQQPELENTSINLPSKQELVNVPSESNLGITNSQANLENTPQINPQTNPQINPEQTNQNQEVLSTPTINSSKEPEVIETNQKDVALNPKPTEDKIETKQELSQDPVKKMANQITKLQDLMHRRAMMKVLSYVKFQLRKPVNKPELEALQKFINQYLVDATVEGTNEQKVQITIPFEGRLHAVYVPAKLKNKTAADLALAFCRRLNEYLDVIMLPESYGEHESFHLIKNTPDEVVSASPIESLAMTARL